MIDLLEEDPSLKFSWAETVFLSRYIEENPTQLKRIKSLLHSKQLEIVGGGWVQNDEALPDFELVTRQMQTGFEYLREKLNVSRIKTGWQLDPFGHSSLTAALFEKMGFETLVVSRIDENVRVNIISLISTLQETTNLSGKEKVLAVKTVF
jgi:lysosomal alpha-mannosidase